MGRGALGVLRGPLGVGRVSLGVERGALGVGRGALNPLPRREGASEITGELVARKQAEEGEIEFR